MEAFDQIFLEFINISNNWILVNKWDFYTKRALNFHSMDQLHPFLKSLWQKSKKILKRLHVVCPHSSPHMNKTLIYGKLSLSVRIKRRGYIINMPNQ